MAKKEDKFYKKLKNSLIETTKFPTDYMFKFIIPNKSAQKKQFQSFFNFEGAVIKTKPSKTGKFLGYTVILKVKSADEVINKYKEVSKIEGIISL